MWSPERNHDNLQSTARKRMNLCCRHRPMLLINASDYTFRPQLSIMTYNLFGEDCVLYDTPKYTRETIYIFEIIRYNPDVVCLQEVRQKTHLTKVMTDFGYTIKFLQVNDFHSVAIAYKTDLFEIYYHHEISFPLEKHTATNECKSTHGALFVCLGFKEKFLEGHWPPTRNALIVGTTHLPLRATRSYERTNNAASLLKAASTFASDIRILEKNHLRFYTFIAGDFNSTPDDAAYVSLVRKPVVYSRWAHDMLVRADLGNPNSTYVAKTPQSVRMISELEDLHNHITQRAISLYSLGYPLVHKKNTQPTNGEPWFSYWGKFHAKETLDYIFVISDWDGETSTDDPSPDELKKTCDMRLMALLRMPTHAEMGLTDVHQPVYGEYPSDHMCLMADLELL